MAQITWRNINTPNFGSANSLLASSAEQVTQGIQGLQGVVQEEQDRVVDQNTAALQQAITRAQTTDELNAIDTSQFGADVDPNLVAESLAARQDTLVNQSNEERRVKLQEDKYALDQKIANQPVVRDDNNGTIHFFDPNTGEQVSSTSYTKLFAPTKGTTGIVTRAKQASLSFDQLVKANTPNFADPNAFKAKMTEVLQSYPAIGNKEGANLIKSAEEYYNNYYSMQPEDQVEVSNQNIVNDQAMTDYNNAVDLASRQLEGALGFPAQAFGYKDDTTMSLDDARKNWQDKFDSFGNGDFPTTYSAMQDVLSYPPTGAEFNYLMGNIDQNSWGFITQKDVKDATQKYQKDVLDSPFRQEYERFNELSNNVKGIIDGRISAATANTDRNIRRRRSNPNYTFTTTKVDTSDIQNMNTFMNTLVQKIGDEKANKIKPVRITGFEK